MIYWTNCTWREAWATIGLLFCTSFTVVHLQKSLLQGLAFTVLLKSQQQKNVCASNFKECPLDGGQGKPVLPGCECTGTGPSGLHVGNMHPTSQLWHQTDLCGTRRSRVRKFIAAVSEQMRSRTGCTLWNSSVLTVPHRLMQMELKLPLQDDTSNLFCRPKKGSTRVIRVSGNLLVDLLWFSS